MLVSDIIKSAMRKLGAVASGELPTPEELQDGLMALQTMLRSWSSSRVVAFTSVTDTLTMTAGTAAYTWGSGGNISTVRPHQVLGAFIRDSESQDHEVKLISEGEYRIVSAKATAGRPSCLFYRPSYPLAYIYLYGAPDSAETLYIDSFKPFTETSSFTDVTDTILLPPNYEEAIIYNLAVRLAPEFGKAPSADVVSIANNSFNRIENINSANQVEPVDINRMLPISSGGLAYDINMG